MAKQIGAIAYFEMRDGYSGYAPQDELSVVPLLGKDPAYTGPAEALQSSGRRGEEATIRCLAETVAARDALLALWGTQTTHDDDSGGAVRNVTVTKADVEVLVFGLAGAAVWVVTLTLRTR